MHTLKSFINEQFLTEAKHPVFAGLKLPGGEHASYDHETGTYKWNKDGGDAHPTYQKLIKSMDKRKWKEIDTQRHDSPTGDVMGYGTHYRNGDHVMTIRSSYGNTRRDNYHTIHIRPNPK